MHLLLVGARRAPLGEGGSFADGGTKIWVSRTQLTSYFVTLGLGIFTSRRLFTLLLHLGQTVLRLEGCETLVAGSELGCQCTCCCKWFGWSPGSAIAVAIAKHSTRLHSEL